MEPPFGLMFHEIEGKRVDVAEIDNAQLSFVPWFVAGGQHMEWRHLTLAGQFEIVPHRELVIGWEGGPLDHIAQQHCGGLVFRKSQLWVMTITITSRRVRANTNSQYGP